MKALLKEIGISRVKLTERKIQFQDVTVTLSISSRRYTMDYSTKLSILFHLKSWYEEWVKKNSLII